MPGGILTQLLERVLLDPPKRQFYFGLVMGIAAATVVILSILGRNLVAVTVVWMASYIAMVSTWFLSHRTSTRLLKTVEGLIAENVQLMADNIRLQDKINRGGL